MRGLKAGGCRILVFVLAVVGADAHAQLDPAAIQQLRERGDAEHWTFTVGENSATKYPLQDLCGAIPPSLAEIQANAVQLPSRAKVALPSRFDWRDFDGCTPVRDQAQCGSCWAFATVGAFECNILIGDGNSIDLSEQWLINCNRDYYNCSGGQIAFSYFLDRPDNCGYTGAVLEQDLPYQAVRSSCACGSYAHPYSIHSWAYLAGGSGKPAVADIKQAIWDYGPIAVGVTVGDAFQAYTGGVFNYNVTGSINHLVVLTGWDDATSSWYMRNSWNAYWGEDGYMRISYGVSNIGYGAAFLVYPGPLRPTHEGQPGVPVYATPSNGAAPVPLRPLFSWNSASEADGYDFYLWPQGSSRPSWPTARFIRGTQYQPAAPLAYSTPYFWQVVARNRRAATEGPVWACTTNDRVSIRTDALPGAIVGTPYSFQLQAEGPPLPYAWRLADTTAWSSEQVSVTGSCPGTGQFACDEKGHTVYMFGGESYWEDKVQNYFYQLNTDTWQWSTVSDYSRPTARNYHNLFFDQRRNRLLMFGGAYLYEYDTYYWIYVTRSDANSMKVYNPSTRQWSTLSTSGTKPSIRHACAGYYSYADDAIYIDGGTKQQTDGYYYLYNQTYKLDLATNTWSQLAGTGDNPGTRAWHVGWESNGRGGILYENNMYSLNGVLGSWRQIPKSGEWPSLDSDPCSVGGGESKLFFFSPGSPLYEIYLDSGLGRVMNGGQVFSGAFTHALRLPWLNKVVLTNGPSVSLLSLGPETLPPGFTLSEEGVLSGTATGPGTYRFGIEANEVANPENVTWKPFVLTLDYTAGAPSNPFPADGATEVPVRTLLSWSPSDHATSYDLYLWKAPDAKPAQPTASNLTTPAFTPSVPLEYGAAYQWQVAAENATGQTPGPQWTFATKLNSPPVLETVGDQTVTEGHELAFTLHASDPDGGTLTFGAQNIPPGASFSPQTGRFSWTPGFEAAGRYTDVIFTVSDDAVSPLTDSETVALTVENQNRPPVIEPLTAMTVNEGQPLEFTVVASDPDSDAVTLAAENLPSGALFDAGTGRFTWTPGYLASGAYTNLCFRATDTGQPPADASSTVVVTVIDVPCAPILGEIGNRCVNEGELLAFTLNVVDYDESFHAMSASNLPPGATFDNSTGAFSWTPGFNDAGIYPNITFQVAEAPQWPRVGFESGTFDTFAWQHSGNASWTVTTSAPYEGNMCARSGVITHNQVSTLATTALCERIGFYYSVSSETYCDFLDFVVDGQVMGSWSGVVPWTYYELNLPLAQHSFAWRYRKDYSVNSGSDCARIDSVVVYDSALADQPLSDSETIAIEVVNSPRAPVFNPIGDKTVVEGTLLQFDVAAVDPDGGIVTLAAQNLPDGAAFDPATGRFIWTPGFEAAGRYTDVTFTAVDDETPVMTGSATITIDVLNRNRAPELNSIGNRTVAEGELLQFQATAADPDGDALVFSATNLPPGAAFDSTTATFSWTPGRDAAGQFSGVRFLVADDENPPLADYEDIAITVTNTNAPPVLDPIGDRTVAQGETLRFRIAATDPDGDPVHFQADNLPPGASFDAALGEFVWTPGYDAKGPYSNILFTACDNADPPLLDSEGIAITVLDTTAPTGTVLINEGAAYANTVSVTLALDVTDGAGGGGAAQFCVSNDGVAWSDWESFGTSTPWMLPSGDGEKTVFVMFRDSSGNTSQSAADTIFLDTTRPGLALASAAGAWVNASFQVTASATEAITDFTPEDLTVTNGTVSEFSGSGASYSWTVTPTADGAVSIAVAADACIDAAGNGNAFSNTVSASYDATAPTGSVVINEGKDYSGTAAVALTLDASDGAGSGVSSMRLSNDGTTWSDWEPFAVARTWTLTTDDDVKTVYVEYKDGAGNRSVGTADSITFDTTGPTGSVVINAGATYANTPGATLSLTAADGPNGSGVSEMRLSNDGTEWSDWEAFVPTKAWSLSDGDGLKTVYVQFRDSLLNESAGITDTVELDTTYPNVTLASTSGAYSNTAFVVTATFEEVVTDFAAEDVTVTNGTVSAFEDNGANYRWTVTPEAEGAVTVAVAAGRCRDVAGNDNAASNTIETTCDTTPPAVVIGAPSASLTGSGPVTYTIAYNDAATVMPAADLISLVSSGTASGTISVGGDGTAARTVTVSGISGDGTLAISVQAGAARDLAGNLALATGPSASFTVDNTPPAIVIGPPSAATTRNGPVAYTVTYTGASAVTLAPSNITLNTTGAANGTITVSGTGPISRTVTVSDIAGGGALGISVAAGTAVDEVGNKAPAAGPSATATILTSDINGDGRVNAVDVQTVINVALGRTSEAAADINGDGRVNAVDVQLVINAALGRS